MLPYMERKWRRREWLMLLVGFGVGLVTTAVVVGLLLLALT